MSTDEIGPSNLEDQLAGLAGGAPTVSAIDGSLATVVRRGQRRARTGKVAAGVFSLTLLASGAAALPGLLDNKPEVPAILHEGGSISDEPIIAEKETKPDQDVAPVIEDKPTVEEKVASKEPAGDGVVADEDKPAADNTPPEIKILSPADGAHVTSKTVTFEGEAEPGATVKAGQYEADVTPAGAWRIVLIVSPGANTVKIKAIDEAGNYQYDTIVVHYDAPVAAKKTAPKPEPVKSSEPGATVQFSAVQENSGVEYDPPYSYYSGTAAPGIKITVASDYGTVHTTADAKGNWRQKLWFESAPYGTNTWAVEVSDASGNQKRFEFTGTRPEPVAQASFTATQAWSASDDNPTANQYSGMAAAGSKVKILSDKIDGGWDYVYADDNGNWSKHVIFHNTPAGESTVNVTVQSVASGASKSFSFTSFKAAAPTVAFTASQVYGTCSEELAYDVFHGTAAPGSKVKFFADYIEGGWDYVYANDNGDWEKRVNFPTAPRNQKFVVQVQSVETGASKYFDFTATQ